MTLKTPEVADGFGAGPRQHISAGICGAILAADATLVTLVLLVAAPPIHTLPNGRAVKPISLPPAAFGARQFLLLSLVH